MAVLCFGYMAFDGGRALATGDYIRPEAGEYAGQLGPWANLVSAVGIDPESNAMKGIFLVWGIAGLVITFGFATNRTWGAKSLLVFNILSLWYLMFGTISSAMQIVLLLIRRMARQ